MRTRHSVRGFLNRRFEQRFWVLLPLQAKVPRPHRDETIHCFALMFVVISFTVSAKAVSDRIWASTLSRLCSTVV